MGAMSTYRRCLAPAIFTCAFLMLGAGRVMAQSNANTQKHIMHAIVVAAREVRAYANALGASTDMWGDIQCEGRSDTLTLKQSSVFRVETDSRYYDLSKICGMDGNFRWPRVYTRSTSVSDKVDTWKHWEQLRDGDPVELLFEMTAVQLSVPRCQRLGMLSKSFDPFSAEANSRAEKIYKAHCVYKVPIMHVRIKYSSTEVGYGTDINDQTWDFRVVGSGSRSAARTAQIGAEYSGSLPPAW